MYYGLPLMTDFIVLHSALISFASSDSPQWQGYFLAVGLFVIAIVQSVILQQYFHICFTVGMRLRSAIVAAIYQKVFLDIQIFKYFYTYSITWIVSLHF